MKFRVFVKKACETSSFHGIPYLVKSKLHLFEKLFWLGAIILASYFAAKICWDQWERFRDHPIVYAVEVSWNRNDFPYAGFTLCTDYYHEEDNRKLIERVWGLKADSNFYQYYLDFLKAVNSIRYDNMNTLEPYANDSTLANVDFVDLLLSMQKRIMPPPPLTNEEVEKESPKRQSTSELEGLQQIYAAAITEVGLCRTISQLSEYTNPYGGLKHLPVSDIIYCGFLNQCNTKILPMIEDDRRLTLYLHNINDILVPHDRNTVTREAKPSSSLYIELLVSWTGAEREVRNLPIVFRKCRYPDENNLEYFKIYRPSLCRIECRIKAALSLCQCKPFFYAVAPSELICGIKGMLCLVSQKWTETKCNCMKLCEELTYTSTLSSVRRDHSTKYERAIVVGLTLPRMSMKRRVIFSTDQLIVSFGGAVGLFLGASFISVLEIIYAIVEYCCVDRVLSNRTNTVVKKKAKKDNTNLILNY